MASSTYRGENGTQNTNLVFPTSTGLSGDVIQVRNQIAVAIENFDRQLHEDYPELNRIHPHGVLVIGTYDSLSDEQKKSFNYFRQGLFGLTVITFDELLHRLKQLYCFDEIDNSMAETTSTDFETGNPWQSW